MIYAQFYIDSTGYSKPVHAVPKLGTDGVLGLDARLNIHNLVDVVDEHLSTFKHPPARGYKIIKAERFSDDGVVLIDNTQ